MCCSHAPSQLEQTEQTSGQPALGVRQAWDSGTVLTRLACAEEFIGGGGLLIHPDLFARILFR